MTSWLHHIAVVSHQDAATRSEDWQWKKFLAYVTAHRINHACCMNKVERHQ